MRPDPNYRPHGPIAHRITLSLDGKGTIMRDNMPVKITKVDDKSIRVGCTVVEIEAMRKLLHMHNESNVLQDGME